jgi:flagellar biosynthesis protein FlhG
MPDQAYDLRRLATHCDRAESPRRSDRPALVVVAGGKGGVGTTTVALNLAAAIAQTGQRTLLVDADPRGGDAALLCGIEERHTLGDVLAGRQSLDEASCAGPGGVNLVVGQRGWNDCRSPAAAAGELLEQLDRRLLSAKVVVIDAGNRFDGFVPHVCREADAVLLVTTNDAASVVGTFAAIKTLVSASCHSRWPGRLYLLVNMTSAARMAETVY